MHDPSTVAFEIRYPWKRKPSQFSPDGYREHFITIWHEDPNKGGDDDSCGWFKRAHHGDKKVLEEIGKAFEFDWDAEWGGWFDAEGNPKISVISIVIDMFRRAALKHFKHNWRKTYRFLQANLAEILSFAENPTDSMRPMLTQQYGKSPREDRISEAASIVYGYILRLDQPWYEHPRWHVHHWRFQIHPWQQFKRRFIDKCSYCKKGFKKGEGAYSGWNGGEIWHDRCGNNSVVVNTQCPSEHAHETIQ